MKTKEQFYQELPFEPSDEQKAIIEDQTYPLAIIAAAGSGKTTTIMMKMCYDILVNGQDPSRILGISYTRNAANELKNKYQATAKLPTMPSFETFHALFYRMLNMIDGVRHEVDDYHRCIPQLFNTFSVKEGVQKKDIVEAAMLQYSNSINRLESVDGLFKYDQKQNLVQTDQPILYSDDRIPTIINAYRQQKDYLGFIDFDDMQIKVYRYLRDNPNSSLKYTFNQHFDRIYIDEYQDINPLQIAILNELIDDWSKVVIVGDPEQSIYRFRGSDYHYIKNFHHDHGGKVMHLRTNRRTPNKILDAITPIMDDAKNSKALNKGGKITFLPENKHVLKKIINSIKDHLVNNETCAVLVNVNADANILVDQLAEQNLPVQITSQNMLLSNNRYYKDFDNIYVKAIRENDFMAFKFNLGRMFTTDDPYHKSIYRILQNYSPTDNWWQDIVENNSLHLEKYDSRNLSKLKLLKQMKKSNSINEIITCLLSLTDDYYNRLSYKGINNKGRRETFDYLYNMAKDKDGKSWTPDYFIQHQQSKIQKIKTCTNNSLLVSSVHSAKGLEWDNVYLYRFNNKSLGEPTTLTSYYKKGHDVEARETYDEDRRIFYVAWTRAKKHLYINYIATNIDEENSSKDFIKDTVIERQVPYMTQMNIDIPGISQFDLKDEDYLEYYEHKAELEGKSKYTFDW